MKSVGSVDVPQEAFMAMLDVSFACFGRGVGCCCAWRDVEELFCCVCCDVSRVSLSFVLRMSCVPCVGCRALDIGGCRFWSVCRAPFASNFLASFARYCAIPTTDPDLEPVAVTGQEGQQGRRPMIASCVCSCACHETMPARARGTEREGRWLGGRFHVEIKAKTLSLSLQRWFAFDSAVVARG